MTNHPNRSVDYPEPAIPAGRKVTPWYRWTDIQAVAFLLGVNTTYEMGENFAVKAKLDDMIAKGHAQIWKRGPHQQSPAFYRMIW